MKKKVMVLALSILLASVAGATHQSLAGAAFQVKKAQNAGFVENVQQDDESGYEMRGRRGGIIR
jgi:uncharacterized surface anchored protein